MAYRFAAADTASEAFRPKAISWVLIGGIFAGIVGPQVVILDQGLVAAICLPRPTCASGARGGLAAVSDVAQHSGAAAHAGGAGAPAGRNRPRSPAHRGGHLRRRELSMMNLVMTSAPLAMVECAHSVVDATLGSSGM